MTILELIQAQCRAVGVPEKYAEKIQKLFKIEKEEGIGDFVKIYKDNILPDIQSSEQANQTAVQTAITEYERKHNLKDGKPVENQEPPKAVNTAGLSPEVKAIIEGQQKQLEALTQAVTGMSKTQLINQKRETAKAKLKGKIDDEFMEDYLGRVNLDAENLDAEIENQVKNFTTLKQKFITKAIADGDYTPVNGTVSDSDFDNFLGEKSQETSFEGVKL